MIGLKKLTVTRSFPTCSLACEIHPRLLGEPQSHQRIGRRQLRVAGIASRRARPPADDGAVGRGVDDKSIGADAERHPVSGSHHRRIDHPALRTAKARVAPFGLDRLDELDDVCRHGDFLGQGRLRPLDCRIAWRSPDLPSTAIEPSRTATKLLPHTIMSLVLAG